MVDLHKAARDKATERLEAGVGVEADGEARSMSQPEWLASQYTPDTTAIQHGVRQGLANAFALPQFVMDLADAPNTFISNVLMGKPRQDYLRRFDAASRAYGRDVTGATEYEDFARTPGNIAGDLSLQIGTEIMMPLGGGYTALKAPKKARDIGNGVVDYLDPGFSESRRQFGKNVVGGTAAVALAVPAVKKAATVKTVKKASTAKAAAKPPVGKWDKIIDEIYDNDLIKARVSKWGEEVDEIAELEKRHGDTFSRPEKSRFLRQGEEIRLWDQEYDIRQAMGPENYDRLKELVYEPSGKNRPLASMSASELDEVSRLGRLKGEAIVKAQGRQADLLSPKDFETYRRLNMQRWAERAKVAAKNRSGSPEIERLDREIRDLLRSDPNVNAYRRQRAKARAAEIGDELWEEERMRLTNRYYDAEHRHNADYDMEMGAPDKDFETERMLAAEYDLERHLYVGKQTGNYDGEFFKYDFGNGDFYVRRTMD